ncbi:MAG: hypothetical protein ACREOD_06140 [Candidatus Dormibacteria bacterium]
MGPGPTFGVVTPAYALQLRQGSAVLAVRPQVRARGVLLPLTMVLGDGRLPRDLRTRATTTGMVLRLQVQTATGTLLEVVTVHCRPSFFTVRFQGRLGASSRGGAQFFTNGRARIRTGIDQWGYSPDPTGDPLGPTPTVLLGLRHRRPTTPFAPAPFDLELRTAGDWLGLGLEQTPDATRLELSQRGALLVNYPLAELAQFPDRGPGGLVPAPHGAGRGARWLQFPAVVVTFAPGPLAGLATYHDALRQLGAAPEAAPPGQRPTWWAEPLVDTWGQQLISDAARGDDDFTAAWVRDFVTRWRQRFHVRHFTVVIDSQWQTTLGGATPSRRFGGAAGMRRLIAALHRQGLRVLLWWPLWARGGHGPARRRGLDPTAAGFSARTAAAMHALLAPAPAGLGADGLKLDWGYHVPNPAESHFAHPALGLGAAALLRYMTVLADAAWTVNREALVDASAVAPQFGASENVVRLYDASSARTWSDRAAIVAASDPEVLIDGDGYRLTGRQAVAHIVATAVYGIPALYYATHWAGHQPITRVLAAALGSVLRAARYRGQGVARSLGGGAWAYAVGTRITARTLSSDTALTVYRAYDACGQPHAATVVSALSQVVAVPLPRGTTPRLLRGWRGRPVAYVRRNGGVRFEAVAGQAYRLTLDRGPCGRGAS